jgi:hypothetical protein
MKAQPNKEFLLDSLEVSLEIFIQMVREHTEYQLQAEVQYKHGYRHGSKSLTGSRREIMEAVNTLEKSGYEIESLTNQDTDETRAFKARVTRLLHELDDHGLLPDL